MRTKRRTALTLLAALAVTLGAAAAPLAGAAHAGGAAGGVTKDVTARSIDAARSNPTGDSGGHQVGEVGQPSVRPMGGKRGGSGDIQW
jgi:hypothetical protein